MAQVADSHEEHHIDVDHGDHAQGPTGSELNSPLRLPNMPASDADILGDVRRVRARWKVVTGVATFLSVVALSVGLIVHYAKRPPASTTVGDTIPVTPQAAEPKPFFRASFETERTGVFILQKSTWNASFMVYPTVVKHEAPPRSGYERGSILLTTSEYVFHFEKSFDPRFMVLVRENHLARLTRDDDELKKVFEDSQWPGFLGSIAIFMETEEAYYFAADAFLSNGFFVSSYLQSPYFTPMADSSEYFPRNTNLQVEYELDDGVMIVNYAIGLLPEKVMPQRIADDRIGYFMQRYVQYGATNEFPANVTSEGLEYMSRYVNVIYRRNLERDPITNQTKHPIVYYIDPSVPLRWRQSFADGVNAWAPAFEAAGFKNAIRAVLPTDNEWPLDYRIGDLRYNSISVMLSDQTYALGPSVVDPRSGEIVHSDITFEYGFFDSVLDDFYSSSPVDAPSTTSRTDPSRSGSVSRIHRAFDRRTVSNRDKHPSGMHSQCGIGKSPHQQIDRMMLGMLLTSEASASVPHDLIGLHFADIVMHEVGHTLGLRHNFAGTAQISRSQLRDPVFTALHGLSTSIMDYIPVNIFSDLTANDAQTNLFYQTVIGAYDTAAIAYGYSILDDEVPGYKSPKLTELAQQAPLFLTDEDTDGWTNPYGQRFDLSADPIDYANDRLELVKVLRQSGLADKLPEDAQWSKLWRRERILLATISSTIAIIHPFLGGVNVTHAHRKAGETKYTPEFVSEADQLRALGVLARIIRAEDGLFPAPDEYATYVGVMGYDGEDCGSPTNDYGCLARDLVDMDQQILETREDAILAALDPVLDRIIRQDVNSPLTVAQVLSAVGTAANQNPTIARNQPVLSFFNAALLYLASNETVDTRLQAETIKYINGTV